MTAGGGLGSRTPGASYDQLRSRRHAYERGNAQNDVTGPEEQPDAGATSPRPAATRPSRPPALVRRPLNPPRTGARHRAGRSPPKRRVASPASPWRRTRRRKRWEGWQHPEARWPIGPSSPAPALLGRPDGLDRGRPCRGDRRRAGDRQGGHRQLELDHQRHLHAGHSGTCLGGPRRDQHSTLRLQQGRDHLVGRGDQPADRDQRPAPDDPRREVAGDALLRRRVLPLLRRGALGR